MLARVCTPSSLVRERKRERESEKEGEREGESWRERKREYLFLKGMKGALAPFSYLVLKYFLTMFCKYAPITLKADSTQM